MYSELLFVKFCYLDVCLHLLMFVCIHFVLLMKVHVCICLSHSGVRTLGSADDEEDNSAASWVIRMKMLEKEKKKAEKKVSLKSPLDRYSYNAFSLNLCIDFTWC